jgi:hypothetical protein
VIRQWFSKRVDEAFPTKFEKGKEAFSLNENVIENKLSYRYTFRSAVDLLDKAREQRMGDGRMRDVARK